MNNIDDIAGVGRLRVGCILDEDDVRRETGVDAVGDEIRRLYLSAWIPPLLLEALSRRGAPVQHCFVLLGSAGSAERLVLLVVQVSAAQLRVVMPLSEQVVQQYLADIGQRGRIRMLLGDEKTKELSFTDMLGGFRSPDFASQLMHAAQALPGDPQMLLDFGRLISPLTGFRSLIADRAVTDAMTVLVSNRAVDKVSQSAEGFPVSGASTLH